MRLRHIFNNPKIQFLLNADDRAALTGSSILFDPFAEGIDTLADWAEYRNISINYDIYTLNEIRDRIQLDLETNGNYPSLKNFVTFNPAYASESFLVLWLSWYGIHVQGYKARPLVKNLLAKNEAYTYRKSKYMYRDILTLENDFTQLSDIWYDIHTMLQLLPNDVFSQKNTVEHEKHETKNQLRKQFLTFLLGASTVVIPKVVDKVDKSYKYNVDQKQDYKTKVVDKLVTKSIHSGIPVVISHGVIRLNFIPNETVKAFRKDLKERQKIPLHLIGTMLPQDSLLSSLVTEILIPSLNEVDADGRRGRQTRS